MLFMHQQIGRFIAKVNQAWLLSIGAEVEVGVEVEVVVVVEEVLAEEEEVLVAEEVSVAEEDVVMVAEEEDAVMVAGEEVMVAKDVVMVEEKTKKKVVLMEAEAAVEVLICRDTQVLVVTLLRVTVVEATMAASRQVLISYCFPLC